MDADERGIFEELIASIESGYQAGKYEQKVRENALSQPGPFGCNPAPRAPLLLENIVGSCPPEED